MFLKAINGRKLLFISALFILTVCSALTLSLSGLAQVFNASAKRKLPIYSVQAESKKISISFDCAWGVDYTDNLLNTMQQLDVRCTFFLVEFWAEKYPEYVKKIDDYGHEIGTHSATHPHMSKLNKNAMVSELTTSIDAIKKVTGKEVNLFRAPFGEYNDLLIETASELGLYTIQWDVDSLDWKDLSVNEIVNRVVKKVKSGSIVLFHNQGKHTYQALPTIIRTLKDNGYEFIPIGELIYKNNFYIDATGKQIQNS